MKQYLGEVADICFSDGDARAQCLRHPGKCCPIYDDGTEGDTDSQDTVDLTKDTIPRPKLCERDRWTIVELCTTCKDFFLRPWASYVRAVGRAVPRSNG